MKVHDIPLPPTGPETPLVESSTAASDERTPAISTRPATPSTILDTIVAATERRIRGLPGLIRCLFPVKLAGLQPSGSDGSRLPLDRGARTATRWQGEGLMRTFRNSGAYLEAMRSPRKVGQARSATWRTGGVPCWRTARGGLDAENVPPSRPAASNGRWAYRVLVGATVVNYLTMVVWSLPLISEMAGGSVPFDMRPGGYSFDEARVFLAFIDDAGRHFYLETQQLLDFFYPTLFAVTIAISSGRLAPRYWGCIPATLAIAAGVFDHLENGAVAVMLRVDVESLTEGMVSTASGWTLAKSISSTISIAALLVLLGAKILARLNDRAGQAG